MDNTPKTMIDALAEYNNWLIGKLFSEYSQEKVWKPELLPKIKLSDKDETKDSLYEWIKTPEGKYGTIERNFYLYGAASSGKTTVLIDTCVSLLKEGVPAMVIPTSKLRKSCENSYIESYIEQKMREWTQDVINAPAFVLFVDDIDLFAGDKSKLFCDIDDWLDRESERRIVVSAGYDMRDSVKPDIEWTRHMDLYHVLKLDSAQVSEFFISRGIPASKSRDVLLNPLIVCLYAKLAGSMRHTTEEDQDRKFDTSTDIIQWFIEKQVKDRCISIGEDTNEQKTEQVDTYAALYYIAPYIAMAGFQRHQGQKNRTVFFGIEELSCYASEAAAHYEKLRSISEGSQRKLPKELDEFRKKCGVDEWKFGDGTAYRILTEKCRVFGKPRVDNERHLVFDALQEYFVAQQMWNDLTLAGIKYKLKSWERPINRNVADHFNELCAYDDADYSRLIGELHNRDLEESYVLENLLFLYDRQQQKNQKIPGNLDLSHLDLRRLPEQCTLLQAKEINARESRISQKTVDLLSRNRRKGKVKNKKNLLAGCDFSGASFYDDKGEPNSGTIRNHIREMGGKVSNETCDNCWEMLESLDDIANSKQSTTEGNQNAWGKEVQRGIGDLLHELTDIKRTYNEKHDNTEKILNELSGKIIEKMDRKPSDMAFVASKEAFVASKEWLKEYLGGQVFEKLKSDSQKALITAKLFYDYLEDYDGADYSGVCVLATKALEIELHEIFGEKYFDYIKTNFKERPEKWPSVFVSEKGGKCELKKDYSIRRLSLGDFVYLLDPSAARPMPLPEPMDNKSSTEDYLKMEYSKGRYQGDYLKKWAECIKDIKDNFRNKAAHTELITKDDASECLGINTQNIASDPKAAQRQIESVTSLIKDILSSVFDI